MDSIFLSPKQTLYGPRSKKAALGTVESANSVKIGETGIARLAKNVNMVSLSRASSVNRSAIKSAWNNVNRNEHRGASE